ncbi:MAG: transglycosylase domain-containing protein [Solirubrobacterales bacterium]
MGNKPKKTRKEKIKLFIRVVLFVFIFAAVASAGVGFAIISSAPELNLEEVLNQNQPSTLYDSDEKYMDTVSTDEKRIVISFSDMPKNLKNAFISIEDERFYKHPGIDIKRIFGVIFIDIKNKLSGSSSLQGASTITQQLIKITTLSSETTITRKVQEWYLALKLEKEASKDQILEAYMNTIFLGGKSFGVEAASEQYFNKPAKDLTLLECAYIAGVPQSPSVLYAYSPTAKKNPSVYINRTKSVLERMYANNYITKEQYTAAISDLDNKKLVFTPQAEASNRLNYEWFSLPAIQQVKEDLKSQLHYDDASIEKVLMYGGLKIYTTMDKKMQDNTQAIFDDASQIGLSQNKDKNGILQPEASAVIMDYQTGNVKVIIGGRGVQPARSFNRAASNNFLRPSGSSIKPLTVYGAAIDSNLATAGTVIDDSPLPASIGALYGSASNPYNPKNDNLTYSGLNTLRSAITHSINVIAVKLEHQIGLKTGISYGEKFGLTLDNDDKTSISAIALGQLHHGTNPLTMAAAYGVFGNQGTYTSPILYTKVVDKAGKTILENKTETRQVLSAQSAYIMYDLLKGPVSDAGTGPAANFGNIEVRGKTGTSGDKRDLWFCGLTPYYSAAVWIGNDDNSVTYGVSSNTAAAIWGKIMRSAHTDLSPKTISMPSGISTVSICTLSGKLATSACSNDPRGSKVVTEMFIDGTIPTDICDVHIEAKVNKITGNLAGPLTPSMLTETKVFLKKGYTTDPALLLPSNTDQGNDSAKPDGATTTSGNTTTGSSNGKKLP